MLHGIVFHVEYKKQENLRILCCFGNKISKKFGTFSRWNLSKHTLSKLNSDSQEEKESSKLNSDI